MLEKKSVINTIKRAFQSGSLQLIGQQLHEIPKQLLNLQNFDLSDQNWWDCNPITKLDFSNNEIKTVPEDIEKLKDIQVIRLKSNLLKTLPKQIFFQTLKLLDVSKNKIEHIPKELYNAVCLVELNLSTNNLVECPNISSITTLEVLYIDNNKIEILTNLPPNLKRLDASGNALTRIRQSYFANTLNIEQIILNKNSIKQVEPGSFMRCNKLVSLEMKENKLEKFDEVPFSDKLDNISLNYNRIREFNKFENCPNLTILILADNKLEKLSGDIVLLKKLKTLDVSNNDLSDLPSQLGLLPQLVRIQLDGNPLKCIRPNIRSSGVQQLKKYLKDRIDPNKIQIIEKKTIDPKYNMNSSLDYWDKLIMEFTTGNDLDLKNRNLNELDPRVFKKNLRTFNVSKNNLSKIGEQIQRLEEIKVINLSENSIEVLPESLLYLNTLEQLDVKRNKISSVFSKNSKSHLMNLYFLDISVNKLTEIPLIFTQFPRLRILHLSYNKLTSMQLLFDNRYFNSLEVIDVSNNQISQISDNVWNRSPTLNFLNVENNNLIKLPTLIGFMKLTALKVEGNPLKFIKRPVIAKGTVALLEDLRTKHVGQPPKMLSVEKIEIKEPEIQHKNPYVQTQNFTQKQEWNASSNKSEHKQEQSAKYSKQQINNLIKEKNTKIAQLQGEIQNNFSLNKIQKAQKRRMIQQLLVERSQIQQLLK